MDDDNKADEAAPKRRGRPPGGGKAFGKTEHPPGYAIAQAMSDGPGSRGPQAVDDHGHPAAEYVGALHVETLLDTVEDMTHTAQSCGEGQACRLVGGPSKCLDCVNATTWRIDEQIMRGIVTAKPGERLGLAPGDDERAAGQSRPLWSPPGDDERERAADEAIAEAAAQRDAQIMASRERKKFGGFTSTERVMTAEMLDAVKAYWKADPQSRGHNRAREKLLDVIETIVATMFP